MTRNERLATVIRLACQVEDRTDAEQRTLIAVAWDCDRDHNKLTITNRAVHESGWVPQDLVSLVMGSRVCGDRDHEIGPPKRWEATWAGWRRDWPLFALAYGR